MKKNELLNLLYVERQRLSEQNSHIGWSIWILIGCIITLSWMLLEHYETSSMKSDQFCWSQIVTLMGDFITVAFALLLIMIKKIVFILIDLISQNFQFLSF